MEWSGKAYRDNKNENYALDLLSIDEGCIRMYLQVPSVGIYGAQIVMTYIGDHENDKWKVQQ